MPEQPETKNGRDDDDGCPDGGDRDKDGIPDELDKCPDQPEDKDGFKIRTAAPISTTTRTAFRTSSTSARWSPRPITASKTKTAAPTRKKGRVMLTKGKILILDKVYFDTGKATIKPIRSRFWMPCRRRWSATRSSSSSRSRATPMSAATTMPTCA